MGKSMTDVLKDDFGLLKEVGVGALRGVVNGVTFPFFFRGTGDRYTSEKHRGESLPKSYSEAFSTMVSLAIIHFNTGMYVVENDLKAEALGVLALTNSIDYAYGVYKRSRNSKNP